MKVLDMTLLDILHQDRLLPLFTPQSVTDGADKLARLQAAGIRAVEITHRSANTLAIFRELHSQFPDLLLGVGTVFTAADVHAFADLGAAFIVSPCLVPDVATACRELSLAYLPGAGTVREVWEAQESGAAAVKIFPGEVLGPAFVRAVKGPLPGIPLLVTGGVQPTRASVGEWLDAGALALGLGSKLFAEPDNMKAVVQDLLTFAHSREATK